MSENISDPEDGIKQDETKLENLRNAIQAGFDSGVAEGDVIGRIHERIRRRAEVAGRSTDL